MQEKKRPVHVDVYVRVGDGLCRAQFASGGLVRRREGVACSDACSDQACQCAFLVGLLASVRQLPVAPSRPSVTVRHEGMVLLFLLRPCASSARSAQGFAPRGHLRTAQLRTQRITEMRGVQGK